MIHELDTAIRNYAEGRLPRLPATSVSTSVSTSLSASPYALPKRRLEGIRMGIRSVGRPMQSATMHVLETTWRVWREPPAEPPA